MNGCPGQSGKKIEPRSLKCGKCGYDIEIFSDEIRARCPKCKNETFLEVMPSCVDWCKSASECVGAKYYKKHTMHKASLLKDRLLHELEDYFGPDLKRITHAKKVMEFAEEILKQECADWNIVMPSAILHDVGIKVSEEKYNSSEGSLQEKEGPKVARGILLKFGVSMESINEICEIISYHHSPGKIDTLNFKVLYDADSLVNLRDYVNLNDKDRVREKIDRLFLTKTGKDIAQRVYL